MPSMSTLQTVPSFSEFTSIDGHGGHADGDHGNRNGEQQAIQNQGHSEAARAEEGEDRLERTITMSDWINCPLGAADFSFLSEHRNMDLIKEEKAEGKEEQEKGLDSNQNLDYRQEAEPPSPPMHLATGLGIDSVDFGSSLDFVVPDFDGDEDKEAYYERMVDDFPCHPLFLRGYAQVLQSKGDHDGAEDYFLRATLADPDSAEILFQYNAQFVWQVRHDRARALTYFERAAKAAPRDSDILAAYARFLWEEDSETEADGPRQSPSEETREGAKVTKTGETIENQLLNLAVRSEKGFNTEDDYKKLVEENPQNPLVLRNYARFLYQSKGDLQGAEEMYSRAIIEDPTDGEAMAAYAQLVWERYHDFGKASRFFEQAAQVSPRDSQVLGAYASFVWETDQDEKEGREHVPEAPRLNEAITTANM